MEWIKLIEKLNLHKDKNQVLQTDLLDNLSRRSRKIYISSIRMNAAAITLEAVQEHLALAQRLRREVDGEILFDAASRGRYSTDASIYQIMPVGVVVPRTPDAARVALQIAAEEGVPILPRGATTPTGMIW